MYYTKQDSCDIMKAGTMECTEEEFWQMKDMLRDNGVEMRMISCFGGKVVAQIRNTYKTMSETIYGGEKVRECAEREIQIGGWVR